MPMNLSFLFFYLVIAYMVINFFFFPEPINSGRDRYLWVGYILLSFFSLKKKKETWREEEINSGMNSLFNSSIVRTSLAACAILWVG
jgi:hypothetical protein